MRSEAKTLRQRAPFYGRRWCSVLWRAKPSGRGAPPFTGACRAPAHDRGITKISPPPPRTLPRPLRSAAPDAPPLRAGLPPLLPLWCVTAGPPQRPSRALPGFAWVRPRGARAQGALRERASAARHAGQDRVSRPLQPRAQLRAGGRVAALAAPLPGGAAPAAGAAPFKGSAGSRRGYRLPGPPAAATAGLCPRRARPAACGAALGRGTAGPRLPAARQPRPTRARTRARARRRLRRRHGARASQAQHLATPSAPARQSWGPDPGTKQSFMIVTSLS